MGIAPIAAGELRGNIEVTGRLISPFEADAALLASGAYVSEFRRSDGNSTDAPWDWPKTDRDLEILRRAQDQALKAITGE